MDLGLDLGWLFPFQFYPSLKVFQNGYKCIHFQNGGY